MPCRRHSSLIFDEVNTLLFGATYLCTTSNKIMIRMESNASKGATRAFRLTTCITVSFADLYVWPIDGVKSVTGLGTWAASQKEVVHGLVDTGSYTVFTQHRK